MAGACPLDRARQVGERAIPAEWTVLSIGIAKLVAKLWLPSIQPGLDLAGPLADVVGKLVQDEKSRKSLTRRLDYVGDRISAELEPYFRTEYGHLDPGDRRAATDSLAAACERVQADRASLLAHDFEASWLDHELASATPESYLSAAGEAFLAILRRDTAAYVVACAVHAPDATLEIGIESLRRDRAAFAALDQAIAAVPRSIATALGLEDPARFEVDYRRQITPRLDTLSLFGLTDSNRRRRPYPLSVAYISLSVAGMSGADGTAVSVEDVVHRYPRLIIRGDAGSGKTTLLRWLAVRAAERSFPDRLADFAHLLPLLVPLRHHAREEYQADPDPDRNLPSPSAFADFGAGLISDRIPVTWVQNVMRQGRGLVLLDGLDELPAWQLATVEPWLRSLCQTYPDCRYVVTSRAGAAGNLSQALRDENFVECTLEPMQSRAVTAFVTKWHDAAGRQADDAVDRAEIRDLELRLRRTLSDNPALIRLASTPLICALICALSRDRQADVPQDRMLLLRVALEMLLVRRDSERGVSRHSPLTFDEAMALLQDLAYWMLRNGKATVSEDEMLARLQRRLPQLHRVTITPEETRAHLLLRSGLLRSPAVGEVEFIHQAFLEFLAGAELAEEGDWEALVKEVARGHWQETAIYAAGHAGKRDLERLLHVFLFHDAPPDGRDAPKDAASRREGLEFLALACIEVSTDVAPATKREVEDRVSQLVPPRSLQRARLLATAGNAAVRALDGVPSDVDEGAALATVAALEWVGTDAALQGLVRWCHDPRPAVRERVANAWPSFDPQTFQDRIILELAASGFDLPPLTLGPMQLGASDQTGYEDLTVLPSEILFKAGSLRLAELRRLRVSTAIEVDLSELDKARDLGLLAIESCDHIHGGEDGKFTTIFTLELTDVRDGAVKLVRSCPNVIKLKLTRTPTFTTSCSRHGSGN